MIDVKADAAGLAVTESAAAFLAIKQRPICFDCQPPGIQRLDQVRLSKDVCSLDSMGPIPLGSPSDRRQPSRTRVSRAIACSGLLEMSLSPTAHGLAIPSPSLFKFHMGSLVL